MSFNGSGTFVLNVGGYPYQPNTLIVSANVNALLNDIANGLSLTVTRDGQMSMTGPLHMANQLIDGIKNLQFGTTTSSPSGTMDGLFLTAAHTIGLAVNGSVVQSWTATGTTFSGGAITAPAFIPNGSTVPVNGIYLPAANTLGFATNTTEWGSVNSTGNWVILAASSGSTFTLPAGAVNPVSLNFGAAGTGFYAPTPNQIALSASGTQALVMSSLGAFTINAPTGAAAALAVSNFAGNSNITIRSPGAANFSYIDMGRTGNDFSIAVAGAAGNFLGPAAQGDAVLGAVTGNYVFGAFGAFAVNFVTNNLSRGNIGSAGNWTVATPTSGTALTVNGASGATGMSVTGTGAAYTATFEQGTTTADTQIRFNAPTGFSPVLDLAINATVKAYIGVSGSAGAYMSGDSVGDLFIRCDSGIIGLSLTGAAAGFKLSGNSVSSVNADAAGTYYEVGFRSIPVVTVNGAGSTAAVVGWRGMGVQIGGSSTGITLNASIFNAGDVFTGDNTLGSTVTVTQGASVTLRLAGGTTTGNRTVAIHGLFTVYCEVGGATPTFVISGNVS